MLTIAAVSGEKWKYYLEIAREELLSEEEIEGYWLGEGAEALRLKGNVRKQQFRNIFQGFSPQSRSIKLVLNAGENNRQGGWDLMISAPKSVSIAYSQMSNKTLEKRLIFEIHHRAVEKTIDFISEHVSTRRTDTDGGGAREERAGLVVAAFTHQTSRLNDPMLHTHALVINLCYRADGSTGTINSRQMYVLQKQAGSLYRAELAVGLQQLLGVQLYRKGSWFEIAGISEEAINYFSKRRNEIEGKLNEIGYHSAQAKEYANFNTRRPKVYRSREELLNDWMKEGAAFGLSEKYLLSLCGQKLRFDETEQMQVIVNEVSKRLHDLHKPFSNHDVLRIVAEESQGRGIGMDTARLIAKAYLQSDDVLQVKAFQKSQLYQSNQAQLIEVPHDGHVIVLPNGLSHEETKIIQMPEREEAKVRGGIILQMVREG